MFLYASAWVQTTQVCCNTTQETKAISKNTLVREQKELNKKGLYAIDA